MNKIFLALIVLTLVSCTNKTEFKYRLPASGHSLESLEGIIDSLSEAVTTPVNSSTRCSSELERYYKALYNLDGNSIDLDKLDKKRVLDLVNKSFESRLEIRSKLKDLSLNTKEDETCLVHVRATVRALRYVEDYLVELNDHRINQGEEVEFTTLKGEAPYFLVNKNINFKGVQDLRGGDVILSRGNAYTSAAIARIGSVDAQFSHLSLVHEDEKGNLYTSEAHIEVGSLGEPIQTHIEQGNARTVVFRFKDRDIAKRAGAIMYKRVRGAQVKKKNIRYDFGMDYKDNKDLFCSEIIYDGFRQASNGELDVPVFKTKFNRGSIPFLQKLGIKVNQENVDDFETFGPGDIEFDPRFELIAEWRNPARMKDTRSKDLILTKLFEWMETKDYEFRPPGKIKRKAWFSWVMRRTPLIGLALKDKFPKYMTKDQLRLFLHLDEVAEVLNERIEFVQNDIDRPLTPKEIFSILEQFREEDFARYEDKPKKSRFHRYFHP
ncbi:MAG: hypothetical protein ACJAT2_000414 [Bacteriovoracaceae bacterium]|jgi:hypothetical protein